MLKFISLLILLRTNRIFCKAVVLLFAYQCGFAGTKESLRPFTIKDSIAISHIIDAREHCTIDLRGANPPGKPLPSPDGKHYLVITQRGVLSTNRLEATLWILDRDQIRNYISKLSPKKTRPRPMATFSAEGQLQVMSDARWLDSDRIAFLGKNGTAYRQLFIAELGTGTVTAVTPQRQFVSAYDVRGETIAYATLDLRDQPKGPKEILEPVRGKYIYSLLYPKPTAVQELSESQLWTIPSILNIKRHGLNRELPLRLFYPSLALSPNGKFLITVAPVRELPSNWNQYQPWGNLKDLELNPSNNRVLSDDNPWRASRYVLVNLESGATRGIIDAPAARSLGYGAPTKAFWLADSRRAILTNTFLPIGRSVPERDAERMKAPVLTMVDVLTNELSPITYIESSSWTQACRYRLDDITWDQAKNLIELSYVGSGEAAGHLRREIYQLKLGHWAQVSPELTGVPSDHQVTLEVGQDLNESPQLMGYVGASKAAAVVWDPNPQLEHVALGKVSVYHWRGEDGFAWSGLLALPPDYVPNSHLPLVIQTHGFESDQFYTDGTFTTGSGGRGLSARNIIVLQIDMPLMNYETPNDGPFEIAGFEGAIEQLSREGYVDPHRVGVIGFSYSCFHVLYSLTHRPELFAAASITDGVEMGYVQWVMSLNAGDGQQFIEKTNGAVPFGKGLSIWAQTAPGFNLDKVHTPLLISALGRGELIAQWEIYSGLTRLGRPVDMLWLRSSNAAHILVEPRVRYASQQSAVDWFDFWLKGEEDKDPAKAEQYRRWRKLLAEEQESAAAQK